MCPQKILYVILHREQWSHTYFIDQWVNIIQNQNHSNHCVFYVNAWDTLIIKKHRCLWLTTCSFWWWKYWIVLHESNFQKCNRSSTILIKKSFTFQQCIFLCCYSEKQKLSNRILLCNRWCRNMVYMLALSYILKCVAFSCSLQSCSK